MSGFLIAVVVIFWVLSAINSVRKAVAKAQAAGGPDAIRAQIADAAAQTESLARTAAGQRAARVLRTRMQAAVTSSASSPFPRPQAKPYVAPPADQAMTSLTAMEAPTMPAFDSPGLDTGFALYSASAPGVSGAGAAGTAAFGGRQFFLNEGASVAAAAIVAAAIIGPPVGLRSGLQSASDW
jgi:hypothetical protein